jgi:alpha-L-rhamnosidase
MEGADPAGLVRPDAHASRRQWAAAMVRPLADEGVGKPASFLRQKFSVRTVTGSEVLRISAYGLYRCFINGQRVGEDLLTPGWTCYDKRLSYQIYPVAPLLKEGDNVIDIWLADGWFRSQLHWTSEAIYNTWGTHIAAIAEIRAGEREDAPVLVKTDDTWKSGSLPVLRSGIYFGEIYDARREGARPRQGSAVIAEFDQATLVPHEVTPVRELAPLPVKESWTLGKGRTVYDFGQNNGGYAAFTVRGKRGARVIVEHSEILTPAGDLDNANYRSADARLEYVLKGEGEESYRPIFTFQGFRYARVRIKGEAEITSIVSVPITSALHPSGSFTTGNSLVNRLVENTIWSQRANFIEVPTDCPQRDERLGWTGDAQVFAATACYLNDSHDFLVKYLRDVMVDQREDGAVSHVSPDPGRMISPPEKRRVGSTGWGDAICVIPMVLYEHYGDAAILRETLPAMVKWVDYVWSISDGPVVMPPRTRDERGFTFGDWLQPKGEDNRKPLPTIGDDGAATIYLYISSVLTARAARIVGDEAIARRMSERADQVKTAFQRDFMAPSGRLVYDDQTSYALAIAYDMIPAELMPATIRYFKRTIERAEGRIQTGFIGTPALLPALTKIGEPELAGAVFLQEEVPGWLYQVKNGATTIWERWDAILPDGRPFDPAMNSYNHYAYGAVCQWLFEAVAGLRPDPEKPGFSRIIFEPTIIRALSPVKAHHDCRLGRIEAGWSIDNGRVTYTVSVPNGAEGVLVLAPRYRNVSVDRTELRHSERRASLTAGRHTIEFDLE